jgi:hypothetical protein
MRPSETIEDDLDLDTPEAVIAELDPEHDFKFPVGGDEDDYAHIYSNN